MTPEQIAALQAAGYGKLAEDYEAGRLECSPEFLVQALANELLDAGEKLEAFMVWLAGSCAFNNVLRIAKQEARVFGVEKAEQYYQLLLAAEKKSIEARNG